MKTYSGIKGKSARKILRDEIGNLHFKCLKIERGEKDEITGVPANGLGRFHILRVASHPRLEFEDENILLVNWLPTHKAWHHNGPNDPKNKWILDRIKEIRGADYEARLKAIEAYKQRHDMLYLEALKIFYQSKLTQLKDN